MLPTLLGTIDLIGVPESVATARAFVRERLGPADPVLDEVVLLVSEVVTNSVIHSGSRDGGPVTLALSRVDGAVHVEVLDCGSEDGPRIRDDPHGEGGRGMILLDAIAETWGVHRDRGGSLLWFVVGVREEGSTPDKLGGGAGLSGVGG
ncbi:hypothetical protein Sru01_31980 [Sphaerisporangium rufum]|uniref:Histidine kinase/HSP90-like ATPase domain-containing protein n=1 Tax=Sphaerisporangium rufum TaxID=1381558 RepID=A0A919R1W1_9ACTN|nr:ATP-binding protein [Sphaerisporangium rufum]GII78216.1 hypothetical protein Sru01_31980 [Sphaerisporangium rufum]